ncbi:hypothetical protein BDN67DRAFT_975362 [Paxillus ammoniavirescens]|nr:hypothetical protein BDN67DRAFT_975362 [Paxillus ammoniavirescens]
MQFFLALLASIASLSAYTLVGVHALADCTTCPSSAGGLALVSRCVDGKSITHCHYDRNRFMLKSTFCNYDNQGNLHANSKGTSCPSKAAKDTKGCTAC